MVAHTDIKFNNRSELLDVCINAYKGAYGERASGSAMHAGDWSAESTDEKVGKVDAVSIPGPDMTGVLHSE